MKIGKVTRKTTRSDVIPITLPKPQAPIPAPDIFINPLRVQPKPAPVTIPKG